MFASRKAETPAGCDDFDDDGKVLGEAENFVGVVDAVFVETVDPA
jgi:hypothetical protein